MALFALACGFIFACGQIVMNMIPLQLCKMQINFRGVTWTSNIGARYKGRCGQGMHCWMEASCVFL